MKFIFSQPEDPNFKNFQGSIPSDPPKSLGLQEDLIKSENELRSAVVSAVDFHKKSYRPDLSSGFLPGISFRGEGKSIVMEISFAMLIFLLLSDQISGGRAKVSEGGKLHQGGAPRGRKPG